MACPSRHQLAAPSITRFGHRARLQRDVVPTPGLLKKTALSAYMIDMSDAFEKDAISNDAARRGTAWLSRAGLRPTRQRVALAALLVGDGQDRHVTAESLHAAAHAAGEQVSLATVYNTLRAFCEAGLIHEISVDGSRSYFDTRLDDHPHFFWEDEGRLVDAPAEDLEIARLPRLPDGAELSRVDVVIRLRRT